MDFKKKAGLALALAAIFTTGGANLALAADSPDNITSNINTTGTVGSDIDAVGEGTALIETDKITTITPDGTLALTGNGKTFKVDGLALDGAKEVNKLTITGQNGAVELAGNGGSLITSNGDTVETVEVTGALLLGNDGSKKSDGGSLENLKVTGVTNVVGGSFDITGTLVVGGNILVGTSTVGKTNGAGELNVSQLDLAGKTLFADPTFAADIYNPSNVTVGNFYNSGTTSPVPYINGSIVAGQNSTITIGSDGTTASNWIHDVIEETEMWYSTTNNTKGEITAALGIIGPQMLASVGTNKGGLMVGGGLTAMPTVTANTASFADNSLFAIDLTGVGNTAATAALQSVDDTASNVNAALTSVTIGGTTATNTFTSAAGGKSVLYLHNAKAKGKYTIFANVTDDGFNIDGNDAAFDVDVAGNIADSAFGGHWNATAGTLQFSSSLLTGTWSIAPNAATAANDDLVLTVERNKAVTVQSLYPSMSNGMAGMVDALYTAGANTSAWLDSNGNTTTEAFETNNAGILFMSRATDNNFLGEEFATEAAATIEGAAQIAVAAGIPAVTSNVLTKISSLIVDHNNMLNATQPAYGNEPGKLGLWATPFYGMSDVDGMDAGRFESGYEMNYGGAAFGLDYNINEAFRLGLALNVGGGDTESEGDFNKTEADFDFFGVSLYGSYSNGAFGLTGDLGYTGVDSEIDQRVPGVLGMGNFKSDVDSDAFTVGLTGQYRFAASDNFNITPHLGLRYTKISVDDTDVNARGYGRVFDVATEDQNLFQIPLGVEFSSNIVTDGGWTVTPSADLGVLFTTGDTDVESRVRIPGTSFTGRTTSDVTDSAAFMGALGVKAAADNGLSLGLDYGILASGNQTDHQFSGMLRFEF